MCILRKTVNLFKVPRKKVVESKRNGAKFYLYEDSQDKGFYNYLLLALEKEEIII